MEEVRRQPARLETNEGGELNGQWWQKRRAGWCVLAWMEAWWCVCVDPIAALFASSRILYSIRAASGGTV